MYVYIYIYGVIHISLSLYIYIYIYIYNANVVPPKELRRLGKKTREKIQEFQIDDKGVEQYIYLSTYLSLYMYI